MALVPDTDEIYTGDGTTVQYAITFPYLTSADVDVTVDGVDVPFSLSTPGVVTLVTAPAVNTTVRVFRNTDATKVEYVFSDGVPFLTRYADYNWRKLLYAFQESWAEFKNNANNYLNTLRTPEAIPSLPAAADRAGKVLAFNAEGAPLTVEYTPDSVPSLDIRLTAVESFIAGIYNLFTRVVPNYAAFVTTSVVLGQTLKLKGHTQAGLGAGDFLVVPSTGLTLDTGRVAATATAGLYAVRISNQWRAEDYGLLPGTSTPNALLNAVTAASAAGGATIHINKGVYDVNAINMPSNVSLQGAGSRLTVLNMKNPSQTQYAIKISNVAVGASPAASTPVDGVSLRGLYIQTVADFGIYKVHTRFSNWDDVTVQGGNIAAVFTAYCFVESLGTLAAFSANGVGHMFGHDYYGWGIDLCSNNVVSHTKLWAYGSGASLVAAPALNSYAGAGIIYGTSLNCPGMLYAEGNNGRGIVFTGFPSIVPEIYVEANDTFAAPADKIEILNDATGGTLTLGNVGVLGGATGSMRCNYPTIIGNYGGTRITGDGLVTANGFYRDATINNPSTLAVPVFSMCGAKSAVLGADGSQLKWTLNRNHPLSTAQFTHNKVYRTYPVIVLEDASTGAGTVEVTITDETTATAVYYQTWAPVGAVTANSRHEFPALALDSVPWNRTHKYTLSIGGANTYTGRVSFYLLADIMV